jgi:colanic acid biosynthesis glycosyl transferase WcaI
MGPAHRRGARLVNWLQDVYPETAVALGVPLMRGPIAASLAGLRNRSLRQADATVVVGDIMAQKVQASGAPAERIHVIANWCNDEDIRPMTSSDNPLRQAWSLAGKFVVGYSGNLGRAHEYETVLATAERLAADSRFVFLMIGGGRNFAELRATVKRRRLDGSFRFMPYQERAMLQYSLNLPDAHWLSLNPQLEGLLVPSKFYGIAAAGKPVIFIGASDGEVARLVRQHGCGIVIAPGDAAALAGALRRWADEPAAIAEMGGRARAMLEANFRRRQALARWRDLLDRLQGWPES